MSLYGSTSIYRIRPGAGAISRGGVGSKLKALVHGVTSVTKHLPVPGAGILGKINDITGPIRRKLGGMGSGLQEMPLKDKVYHRVGGGGGGGGGRGFGRKRPHMNATNPKALKRAIRRIDRFKKFAMMVGFHAPKKLKAVHIPKGRR